MQHRRRSCVHTLFNFNASPRQYAVRLAARGAQAAACVQAFTQQWYAAATPWLVIDGPRSIQHRERSFRFIRLIKANHKPVNIVIERSACTYSQRQIWDQYSKPACTDVRVRVSLLLDIIPAPAGLRGHLVHGGLSQRQAQSRQIETRSRKDGSNLMSLDTSCNRIHMPPRCDRCRCRHRVDVSDIVPQQALRS